MNATGLAEKVFDADEEAAVTPIAVFGFDGFSAVYIPDSNDRGLWFGYGCGWQVDVEESDVCDVEVIKWVFRCRWRGMGGFRE